jgi:uncharacterized membrane protein YfcA
LLACLIVAPQQGYDEPAILSYAISSFCPTSADGLHPPDLAIYAAAVLLGAIIGTTFGIRFAAPAILKALGLVLIIAGLKLIGVY